MKQGRILSSNKDLILQKMASNDSNTQKKGKTKIDQMSAEVIDSNPYRYAGFFQSFTKWTLTREIYKVIPFSANPTKWSNTLKQFVGNWHRFWRILPGKVCLS